MLARLARVLPEGDHWRYEPKFDGFRGLLWRTTSGSVHLLSRNLKDLSASFPELATAGQNLPLGTIVDGEIVIPDADGYSNFGALQQRLGAARRDAAMAAARLPAVLLAFDMLSDARVDVTGLPLCVRRERLEALLRSAPSNLQLIAQTGSRAEADDWLKLVPGIEGVVAKRSDSRYLPGQRDWIKVKRSRSVDCAVIGVAGDTAAPRLVLGLRHSDGLLHHFAVSRPLAQEAAAPLCAVFEFAGAEQAAIPSRWQHDAIPPWRPLPPRLVCEVRVSNLDAGRWSRFPAMFLRWRPDRSPEDCSLEQLRA